MGILNRPSDGSAPVLLALWRAVRSHGPQGMKEEDLLQGSKPPGLVNNENEDRPRKTLNRWSELGLFCKGNGRVTCNEAFGAIPFEADPLHVGFRHAVRSLALAEESNRDFLKPKPAGTADFTLALSWLLATDVYGNTLSTLAVVEELEKSQIKRAQNQPPFVFQNDTRWAGFRDWASFLGFASFGEPFSLDPTEAVRTSVTSFGIGRYRLAQIRDKILEDLPVFPGGLYGNESSEKLAKPGAWRAYNDDEVPPSLTRALLALEADGVIKMTTVADADQKFQLLGPHFKAVRTVSQVEVLKGTDL